MRRLLPIPPLLVITDRKQARAPLREILTAAFDAGCRWASVREKDLPTAQQVALARELAAVARQWSARLTLHGDAALAKEAGVDGVHLPAGADGRTARVLLGPEALVGISIHGATEAAQLDPAVIDYAIAGPAYETASKPGYGPALGAAGIATIARATKIPIIAVGGIDAGNAATLLEAAANGIAAMGGVMRAADPADEVRRLLGALARVRAPSGIRRPPGARIHCRPPC